jgi:hypothetical protein
LLALSHSWQEADFSMPSELLECYARVRARAPHEQPKLTAVALGHFDGTSFARARDITQPVARARTRA